jgi:hypothetical protein
MSLFKYISEFFLFRWLFGFHWHNEAKCGVLDATVNPVDSESLDDLDSGMRYGNHPSDKIYSCYDNHHDDSSRAYDDFLDEQDDYGMMDDDF